MINLDAKKANEGVSLWQKGVDELARGDLFAFINTSADFKEHVDEHQLDTDMFRGMLTTLDQGKLKPEYIAAINKVFIYLTEIQVDHGADWSFAPDLQAININTNFFLGMLKQAPQAKTKKLAPDESDKAYMAAFAAAFRGMYFYTAKNYVSDQVSRQLTDKLANKGEKRRSLRFSQLIKHMPDNEQYRRCHAAKNFDELLLAVDVSYRPFIALLQKVSMDAPAVINCSKLAPPTSKDERLAAAASDYLSLLMQAESVSEFEQHKQFFDNTYYQHSDTVKKYLNYLHNPLEKILESGKKPAEPEWQLALEALKDMGLTYHYDRSLLQVGKSLAEKAKDTGAAHAWFCLAYLLRRNDDYVDVILRNIKRTYRDSGDKSRMSQEEISSSALLAQMRDTMLCLGDTAMAIRVALLDFEIHRIRFGEDKIQRIDLTARNHANKALIEAFAKAYQQGEDRDLQAICLDHIRDLYAETANPEYEDFALASLVALVKDTVHETVNLDFVLDKYRHSIEAGVAAAEHHEQVKLMAKERGHAASFEFLAEHADKQGDHLAERNWLILYTLSLKPSQVNLKQQLLEQISVTQQHVIGHKPTDQILKAHLARVEASAIASDKLEVLFKLAECYQAIYIAKQAAATVESRRKGSKSNTLFGTHRGKIDPTELEKHKPGYVDPDLKKAMTLYQQASTLQQAQFKKRLMESANKPGDLEFLSELNQTTSNSIAQAKAQSDDPRYARSVN